MSNARNIAKWSGGLVLGLLGIVLFVAGKWGAGVALACAALIVLLPLGRSTNNKRVLLWGRVLVVAILVFLSLQSVLSTDLKPEQRVTGYAIIDKGRAIFIKFGRIITGKNTEESSTSKNGVSQEMADEMTACMRQNGLPGLPNATITEDGISFDFASINATQQQIRDAQSACQHILRPAD
ncbi:MAG TPA: hypothetical protein VFT16_00610 [Candidatus Saccharimonadales bacterium]|nr:hypothetical protein [Candidatus Saccharimonadales bacterium]